MPQGKPTWQGRGWVSPLCFCQCAATPTWQGSISLLTHLLGIDRRHQVCWIIPSPWLGETRVNPQAEEFCRENGDPEQQWFESVVGNTHMAGTPPALVLQEWACLKTGSKVLVELPWMSPGHLTQGMVLAKVQLLWEFKSYISHQVCKPLPGRLTLMASALHSSSQSAAERSSRMGHTLPSMSHWEIRPCSTRASSTSWLDFLT